LLAKEEGTLRILGEILEIVFKQSQRYLSILQIHKGVDWAIYA